MFPRQTKRTEMGLGSDDESEVDMAAAAAADEVIPSVDCCLEEWKGEEDVKGERLTMVFLRILISVGVGGLRNARGTEEFNFKRGWNVESLLL